MLFRPSFCANCGEKIDRAQWGIFTSRRFCQVCESEFKGQDLIPRAVVAVGLLIGVFGFGSYLNSGPPPGAIQGRSQSRKLAEQVSPAPQLEAANAPIQADANAAARQPEPQTAVPVNRELSDAGVGQPVSPPSGKRAQPTETTYYCGAETKKGTPCSRRVKGNVRCYQHVGMPAMSATGKLSIK